MRKLIAIMACAGVLASAQAQWQALAPSSLGVVVTAGQWLFFNSKRVYYIEVRGTGRTAEEARMNGFRLAVEQALGSVIASETEQQNSRIRRDEVISYAAGFVERYEIVTTMPTGSGYELAMRVWVQRTNLAERLLVKSQADGQVDGARAAIAVDTAQYSRAQGDLLLLGVLRDFPERSFDIRLESTRVEMNSSRNTELIIPFKITWNRKYTDSFFSARKAVSTCGWNGCDWDKPTQDLIVKELFGSYPQILITVNSVAGTAMYRRCFPLEQRSIVDRGEQWRYNYNIPATQHNLADMSQAEVRVVRLADCPSQVLF
jgi:hypothetical protein